MRHILIVINGDIADYSHFKPYIEDVDHVVAVDGGSRHIKGLGVVPDVLLGDFDSIGSLDAFVETYPNLEVREFPPRKNFTDSELAVEYAIEQAPELVTMLGCIGSRMDHTMATVFLLKKFLDAGIRARIVNEYNEIVLIASDTDIYGKAGDTLSIVPISGKASGITLRGLEYPLNDATLVLGSSTGVSNVFVEDKARVELKEGLLLVFKSRD